ncbi:MAG: carbohydrate kinase [Bacteroidetes bacterium]|nr:carbohydrate kinase [Bacteroidota bacterium]MCW5895489.1 carbohydrate kinase [Bacteroidota bacterium]
MAGSDSHTITTVGEAIVDFVSTAPGLLVDAPGFVKALGGEGANVAVGLAKLGSHSCFVGKVGADSFGRFLVKELEKDKVDVGGVVIDKVHRTRLAFVSLTKEGERDFEFWEKTPAGEQLLASELNSSIFKASRIVNIAPLLLPKQPARSTAFEIADDVKSSGGIVAFDANVRLGLWKSAAEAKRVMLHMARRTSVLRLNDEEATFLTGHATLERAAAKLRLLGPELVAITLGVRGSYFQAASSSGFIPGFNVKAVDTTGCGDAFFAALLHRIASVNMPIGDLSAEELTSMCRFANAVGALTSRKRGGAAAVPFPADVVRFLKRKNDD